eukprot:381764-Amphidinium_carterae.1
MVDKSSFMQMLLHVLNVEAGTDHQIARWEEELTVSGARNRSDIVDVKHFVAFCMLGGVARVESVLGVLCRPQQEDERLADPSEHERLDGATTKPGSPSHPSGGDMSSSSWT